MLTGKELGQAIKMAIQAKGVTQKVVAAHFGVQPPSISDWIARGTIAKDKLPDLWRYFSDVVGPEHWGLDLADLDPRFFTAGHVPSPKSDVITRGGYEVQQEAPNYPGVPVNGDRAHKVFVVGRGTGGLPERVWTDGGYLTERTDDYAVVATTDNQAFLVGVHDRSMISRYNPGEFALVEPNTEPEVGDDVLVRLATGQTIIKKLVSRRGHVIELYSYNEREQASLFFKPEEISWMYYIAHPVPARKIKPLTT